MYLPGGIRRCLATAIAIAACALVWTASIAADGAGQWQIAVDNDMWVGESDRHYTHGTRIGRRSDHVPPRVARAASRLPCAVCREADTFEFVAGQSIYTPEETWRTRPVADDRPYAGWLYLTSRLGMTRDTGRGAVITSVGATFGVIGPASMAEDVQAAVHRRRDREMPQGWSNQLGSELGFFVDYERRWRRHLLPRRRVGFDVEPFVTGAMGTVHTHLGGGLGFRLGNDRPGRQSLSPQRGWSLFFEAESRYVVRNIFLDGNTFADSHRVGKLPFVHEARMGLSVSAGPVRIRIAQNFRSREFAGQLAADSFGSISFDYRR